MFQLILKAYQEVAVMSALGQKLISSAQGDVRFVPIADIGTSAMRALFNHVVSSGDYRGRHG
jgi:hypothetical protein